MNAKQALRGMMDMSWMVLNTYLGDLNDADLMKRPGPGCNHLAWQWGHLITAEAGLLNSICPGAAPELPAGFGDQHSKETTGIDDPAKFYTKQQYLDWGNKVREATNAALEQSSDTDLDLPAPEKYRDMFPTRASIFMLIGSHPMMHAGQVVPVRRALGKPIVM